MGPLALNIVKYGAPYDYFFLKIYNDKISQVHCNVLNKR